MESIRKVRNLTAFGEDKSKPSSLRIVLNKKVVRHKGIRICSVSCERCNNKAVFQMEITKLNAVKKSILSHFLEINIILSLFDLYYQWS